MILGCSTTFLLRCVHDDGNYRTVGECYVCGLMDGEAVEMEEILYQLVILDCVDAEIGSRTMSHVIMWLRPSAQQRL